MASVEINNIPVDYVKTVQRSYRVTTGYIANVAHFETLLTTGKEPLQPKKQL